MDHHGHHMSGMDSASSFQFRPQAERLSHIFWYLVVTAVAVGLLLNILQRVTSRTRAYHNNGRSTSQPTIPKNFFSQTYATLLAVGREMTYAQGFRVTLPGLRWLTPLPVGKNLLILLYWITIISMLTVDSIKHDAYYWERMGFRAAWISVMQVPFVIILSGKVSIVGFLVGTSAERLNWLHRWAGRTLFVCVTVHGAFFYDEWARADFVKIQLEGMPVVKYGIGAWFVLLWTIITSLLPIRHMAYEFFVIQHVASWAVLFWLIYMHIPIYALYYLWIGIGFVVFDRVARIAWFTYVNFVRTRFGYNATLTADGDVTVLSVPHVPFKWSPGQHVYLSVPRAGIIEAHPFTIANAYNPTADGNELRIAIRAHGGFSKRLHRLAVKTSDPVKTFIQGPFGRLVKWNTYESVVLIAASTGTSFTLPILESIINDPCCVRRVSFVLLVREKAQCACYLDALSRLAANAQAKGIALSMQVAVSQETSKKMPYTHFATSSASCGCVPNSDSSSEIDSIQSFSEKSEKSGQKSRSSSLPRKDILACSCGGIRFSSGRALLPNIIREAVEGAHGETAVAVCGGHSISTPVRNAVAALSDERAVHKGTGAQGIFLHVEEFGM